MTRPALPYGRQHISEEDVRAVVECLESDWLTQGPRVEQFENRLCELTNARHAIAVSSGTAALELVYQALGLGPGDWGLTSAISFVATANALLHTGASVSFCDADPRTGLVDPESLEQAARELARDGRPPKLLVPVDLAGLPVDRARIQDLARRYSAYVVEDAAHSLGASYEFDGQRFKVGSCAHATAAILSFHPVKHVTTAEGGAVLTNDAALCRRLLELRTHGIRKAPEALDRPLDDPFVGPWYYEQHALGHNFRISDLQCALGVSQLGRLDQFLARRRQIARRYDAALSTAPLSEMLRPLDLPEGVEHAYHLYVVQLRPRSGESDPALALRRKKLFIALRQRGIFCQVHYIPIPWQPYYRDNPRVRVSTLAGAERYYAASLSLPMFFAMSDSDVDRVIETLIDCTGSAA